MANFSPDDPQVSAGAGGQTGPLSESQLADLIEGSLSPEQTRHLLASSGRADLAPRIAQMQRQRSVLASLPTEKAPRDLHDLVLARLEREALVGAGSLEPSGTTDIRVMRPADERTSDGVLARITSQPRSTWIPRLAMAAGLVLVAGGLSYFIAQATKGIKPLDDGLNGRPIAAGPAQGARDEVVLPGPLGPNEPGVMAAGDADAAVPSVREAQTPMVASVPLREAVPLAQRGQLAMRVVARDLGGLEKVQRIGSRGSPARPWKLETSPSATRVAMLLPAMHEPALRTGPAMASSNALASSRAMASVTRSFAPVLGPGALLTQAGANPGGSSGVRASFVLSASNDADVLESVRTFLERELDADVVLIDLPADVRWPAPLPTPEQTLWWEQPPARWAQPVHIPVVIEQG